MTAVDLAGAYKVPAAVSGAAAGGLTTVLDVDFRGEANQTLSPDGTFSIAGKTWQSFGTANLTSLALVAGTGLVVTFSATNVGGGVAGIALVAGQLPTYRPGAPTWILVDADFTNLANDFAEAAVGLIEPGTPSRHLLAGRKFNSFVGNDGLIVRWNGQVAAGGSSTVGIAFDDVLAAFVDGRTAIEGWHGALAAGELPDLDDLVMGEGNAGASQSTSNYGTSSPVYAHVRATPGFSFATDSTGCNGDTATIRRMKVLQ